MHRLQSYVNCGSLSRSHGEGDSRADVRCSPVESYGIRHIQRCSAGIDWTGPRREWSVLRVPRPGDYGDEVPARHKVVEAKGSLVVGAGLSARVRLFRSFNRVVEVEPDLSIAHGLAGFVNDDSGDGRGTHQTEHQVICVVIRSDHDGTKEL